MPTAAGDPCVDVRDCSTRSQASRWLRLPCTSCAPRVGTTGLPLGKEIVNLVNELRSLIDSTLALGGRLAGMSGDEPLLGAVAELDSVGVVAILTALEDRYGLAVEDDEISADTFATLDSLAAYVASKR